jgi:hypothetical protein
MEEGARVRCQVMDFGSVVVVMVESNVTQVVAVGIEPVDGRTREKKPHIVDGVAYMSARVTYPGVLSPSMRSAVVTVTRSLFRILYITREMWTVGGNTNPHLCQPFHPRVLVPAYYCLYVCRAWRPLPDNRALLMKEKKNLGTEGVRPGREGGAHTHIHTHAT